MPIRFTSRLLDHLRHDGYRPSTIRVIVKDLRIADEERLGDRSDLGEIDPGL